MTRLFRRREQRLLRLPGLAPAGLASCAAHRRRRCPTCLRQQPPALDVDGEHLRRPSQTPPKNRDPLLRRPALLRSNRKRAALLHRQPPKLLPVNQGPGDHASRRCLLLNAARRPIRRLREPRPLRCRLRPRRRRPPPFRFRLSSPLSPSGCTRDAVQPPIRRSCAGVFTSAGRLPRLLEKRDEDRGPHEDPSPLRPQARAENPSRRPPSLDPNQGKTHGSSGRRPPPSSASTSSSSLEPAALAPTVVRGIPARGWEEERGREKTLGTREMWEKREMYSSFHRKP